MTLQSLSPMPSPLGQSTRLAPWRCRAPCARTLRTWTTWSGSGLLRDLVDLGALLSEREGRVVDPLWSKQQQ